MRVCRLLSLCFFVCLCVLCLPLIEAGRNFYQILGVERSATERQIKKAYRQMSKLYHPDKNKGDEEASKKFVDIAAAYECLSDKDKRRIYDQGGEDALKQQGNAQQANPFDMFSNFGGFNSFFGGQQHRGNEEKRGDDIKLDLYVTLEDLYNGKVYEVLVKQRHLCPHCHGSGADRENDVKQCNTCQGRGVVIKMHQLGPGFVQQVQQPCDVCGGKGKIIKSKCRVCKGHKTVKGHKKLDVMVELGMPDGHKIEFENAADEHPDHAAGHIVFTINTLPHARFTRQGKDLHYTQQITLLESLVGFSREIAHLDGHNVTISSTGVTQHGDVQRVSGEGMPTHNQASRKGDLFVKYEVIFPKSLTKEQKEGFATILSK